VSRPDVMLASVDAAFAQLLATASRLTDADARGASRLPGWTRAHVLTHVARSADGDRSTVEGAIRGEVADKYPHGLDGRERDIEAGARRDAATLLDDVDTSQRALVAAWAAMPDDAWERLGNTPMGLRNASATVGARRRELLVHLVDLDAGFGAADLPADYVDADREWLREFRTPETWPGVRW